MLTLIKNLGCENLIYKLLQYSMWLRFKTLKYGIEEVLSRQTNSSIAINTGLCGDMVTKLLLGLLPVDWYKSQDTIKIKHRDLEKQI